MYSATRQSKYLSLTVAGRPLLHFSLVCVTFYWLERFCLATNKPAEAAADHQLPGSARGNNVVVKGALDSVTVSEV